MTPDTIVDRYVIEGLLGEGGMAVVYRARHRDLGSLHAIKQLRVKDPAIRDRLLQEGRLQSGLRHPNVVSVTDLISLDGSPALVMEYVKGPTLADLLAHHRPTIIQCDAIARGILKGVSAAHAHGMVHRDLKPANILIAATEDEVIPKIADFGLAKVLEGEVPTHGMTQAGATMGTPGYMAPEQINDASSVDRRADVFSLGAILYELVSGRHCFEGEGLMAIWRAICEGDFVPPKRQVPALPDRMVQAIEGALVVDREQRISKVSDLLSVWSTDAEGVRVPILEDSKLEFSEEGPRALAHALTLAHTPEPADFAFGPTHASVDAPSPLDGAARAKGEALPGRPSSPLPWMLAGGVLTAALVGAWWLQRSEPPPPQTPPAQVAVEPTEVFILAEGADAGETRRMASARRALLAGEHPLAERLLNGLLKTRPKSPPVRSLLSLNHFFRGRATRSAQESRRATALARDGEDDLARMIRLADRSWREVDNGAKLLPRWNAVRAAHPRDPLVELLHLVAARFLLGPTGSLTAIRAAALKFPEHVVWTTLALHILETQGRHAERLEVAQEARTRFPAAAGLLLELARSQLRLGRLEEAERNLKEVLTLDGSLTAARTALAGLYVRTNDEAARLTQLTVGLGDTTAPLERLALLRKHGVALAAHGRMRAADMFWVRCVTAAQALGDHDKALECSDAALNAGLWLLPVERWGPWLERTETLLARPELDPALRELYSVKLIWLKATAAARSGDPGSAEAFGDSLRSLAEVGSAFGAATFFEREIRLEVLLARKDRSGLKDLLAEYPPDATRRAGVATCVHRFRETRAAMAVGDVDEADRLLTGILAQACAPGPLRQHVTATSRVLLARIRVGQGRGGDARALLDAFADAWPAADPDLPLAREAAALRETGG